MDPAQCREKMSKLITEESTGLARLIELLEHEHGLLLAGDSVALSAAINERQRCVGRIQRVDDERRAMCRALNLTLDAPGAGEAAALVRSGRLAVQPLGRMRGGGKSLPHAERPQRRPGWEPSSITSARDSAL